MDFLAAAGNALTSFAGSWFDNRQDTKRMREANEFNAREAAINRAFQADQASIDREMQRDFAENGIKMRVDDAVRAGLHPLVGAGVQPYSASPIGVGGSAATSAGYPSSTMGQNISRAIQATQTKEERAYEDLRMQLLRSQINETDMRTWALANEIQRKSQSALSSGPFPAGAGQVTVQPDVKISQALEDPSRTAGADHPFFKRYEVFPGFTLDIPYSQEGPAEGMEGVGALGSTIIRNLLYRPAQWWKDRGSKAAVKKLQEFGEWVDDPHGAHKNQIHWKRGELR